MCCWSGNASGPLWGWWWLMPVIGIALCIMICLFFRSRFKGGRFCCFGSPGPDNLEEMKKEISDLKEELAKIKGNKENTHG
jgi:hypothetical protein